MTSLPPRPGSPPKRDNDRPDSRYNSDDRDRRAPRYPGDRDDRFPRPRGSDSYIGDSRRDSDSRRRDYGDRERDRDRDRDWDRGGWDRSRDSRDRDRGSRYSPPPRDRYRGPTRERSAERGGGRYASPDRDRYRDSHKYSPRRDRSPPRRGMSLYCRSWRNFSNLFLQKTISGLDPRLREKDMILLHTGAGPRPLLATVPHLHLATALPLQSD
jgi:hypothetical protein